MDVLTSHTGIVTSTDLPTTFPDISVFDLRKIFGLGFGEPFSVPNRGTFTIDGELTHLEVVPEPATFFTLSLGSLFLRRKRH
jgi:hypothetical protein